MSITAETATFRPTGTTRTTTRRRAFARAFALGATVSALAAGGTYAAVGSGRSDHVAQGGAAASSLARPGAQANASSAGSAAAHTITYQQGAWVGALQRKLGQLNYYEGPTDGVLGPQTLAAITDFQRANGLTADGIAGTITMTKIDQQLTTGDSQMWPTGPPVKPGTTTPSAHESSGTSTTGGASIHGGTTSPTSGASGTASHAATTTGGAAPSGTTGGAAPSGTTAAN